MDNKLNFYLIKYKEIIQIDIFIPTLKIVDNKFVLLLTDNEDPDLLISSFDGAISIKITEFDYYNKYLNYKTILNYKNYFKII